MAETTKEVENIIYSYVNDGNKKVYTPNLEFAHIMAKKYGTDDVFIEKN
jgi:hypothetical protein